VVSDVLRHACPAKQRNNKEYLGKGSYFLSTKATGNHSIVAGYDEFHQLRNENNFQSGATSASTESSFATKAASQSRAHRSVRRNSARRTSTSAPIRARARSNTTRCRALEDFRLRGALALHQRQVDLNPHWGFNVGWRYDKDFGHDQAGNKTSTMPRRA